MKQFSPNLLLKKMAELSPEAQEAIKAQAMLNAPVPTTPGGNEIAQIQPPQPPEEPVPQPVQQEPVAPPTFEERAAAAKAEKAEADAERAKLQALKVQKEIDEGKDKSKGKTVSTEYSSMSPEFIAKRDEVMNRLNEMASERMAEEQQGISDYEKGISDFQSQKQNYDFRPIAGLVDKWAGGGNAIQSAAAAMAPQSQAERQKQLSAMRAQLSAMKGGLSKSQYDVLKAQLDSYNDEIKLKTSENQSDARMKGTQDRFDLKQVEALGTKMKDLPDITSRVVRLTAMVPDVGSVAGVGVGAKLFKDWMLSEKGRAVQQDAKDILSAVMKIRSGLTVTDAERKMIEEVQGMAANSTEASFKRGIKNLHTFLISTSKGLSGGYRPKIKSMYEKFGDGITPDGIERQINDAVKKANKGASSGLPSDKQKRLEELRAKKAAGGLDK